MGTIISPASLVVSVTVHYFHTKKENDALHFKYDSAHRTGFEEKLVCILPWTDLISIDTIHTTLKSLLKTGAFVPLQKC